jgi:hypothetical protein
MALALLCSKLVQSTSKMRATAFVIDHAARAESAHEALIVKANVEKLGER